MAGKAKHSPAADFEAQRAQFITRVPSSALLSEAAAASFYSPASVALLRVKAKAEASFLDAVMQQTVRQLSPGVAWHLMRGPGQHWVLIETCKAVAPEGPVATPSTGSPSAATPTSTPEKIELPEAAAPKDHGGPLVHLEHLATLLSSVSHLMDGPSQISRCRVIMDCALVPAVLDNTACFFETLKVKTGQESYFADLARDFLGPPPERDDFTASVYQDFDDSRIFSVLYHFTSSECAKRIRTSEFWDGWKRRLAPLIDGRPRSLELTGVFNSRRGLVGLTDTPVSEASPPETGERLEPIKGAADGADCAKRDPNLANHVDYLRDRFAAFTAKKRQLIEMPVGGVAGPEERFPYATAYRAFGLVKENGEQRFRDWQPRAKEVYLFGEFNEWDRSSHPLQLEAPEAFGEGVWSAVMQPPIPHKSKYKLRIVPQNGEEFERVPAWTTLSWMNEERIWDAVCWQPEQRFEFRSPRPRKPSTPKVYEAHIGISSSEEKVSTYAEFQSTVLPRVARLGYDTLLLLGVVEHEDYSTFGWHVSSYFAPSSRFGSITELQALVDAAHRLGISVLMSIIHSHASGSRTVGPGEEFFPDHAQGLHPIWDARIFDYSNPHVCRFLLSNLRYFIETFNIDGFRFEGVTSMLYHHHGIAKEFPDASSPDYGRFFNYDLDTAAGVYLMLANEVVHGSIEGGGITIASDSSEFPTLCMPVAEGGVGFDFRLSMNTPTKLAQAITNPDINSWNLREIVHALETRHLNTEKTIAYTENFDLSLKARRPIKIALFAWESLMTHFVGGVAPHVTELAAGLARLGHEVHVFTRATSAAAKYAVHYGVHYHECPFDLDRDFVREVDNMCHSFIHQMHETEQYMKAKFDICHGHDWLAGRAVQLAKQSHATVYTMHSTEYGRCGNQNYEGQSRRVRQVEHDACNQADRVVCVSGVLAQEVQHLYGVHPAKIRVVYNGINAQHFDAECNPGDVKAKYGIAPMDPMLLCVGRAVLQKGVDILIEAVPFVLKFRDDTKFVVVGDGHMLDGIRQRANVLGVGHAVRFVGKKGGGELVQLFKASDAVVVPSRNEPFGIVVLESWSACKPVVATTSGGPRDFVTPNVDGILVEPEPGSVAWGCCEILKNFEHARWMGSRGRVKAAFSFSWDAVARQTRDVYYEQLNKHDSAYGQFMQGDCGLAFRLMGDAMYEHMHIFDDHVRVNFGAACYKMLRLMVAGLGGEGFLNFMGCEFAHPEWVDLPRPSNGFSQHHARRRWDLADDKQLKYKHFELFESVMMHAEKELKWMSSSHQFVIFVRETDRVVAFERGDCLFVFNFHPEISYEGYLVGHSLQAPLSLVFDTDESRFGGHDRLAPAKTEPFPHVSDICDERAGGVKLYLPSMAGLVLASDALVAALGLRSLPAVTMGVDQFLEALPSMDNPTGPPGGGA